MVKPQAVPSTYLDLKSALKDDNFTDAIAYRIHRTQVLLEVEENFTGHHKEYAEGLAFAMSLEALRDGAEANTKLFYCDQEMSSAIETGCRLFEEEDTADASLIPSRTGFAYFSSGVRITENMVIHGLYWFKIDDLGDEGREKTVVVGFNDKLNESDGAKSSWDRSFEGREIPDTRWIYRSYHMYDETTAMVHSSSAMEALKDDLKSSVVGTTLSQVMHAFLLMVSQPPEIVTTSTQGPTNKKQINRLSAKNVPSEVTVIDIRHRRKSISTSASPSNIEYSRRWYVEGHWRWQPFKNPETREWARKRIWINSYIKGPDDKPFVATKRVYALLK